MTTIRRRGSALAGGVLALGLGCTSSKLEPDAPLPGARERWAARLAVELPPAAGPDALVEGPSVWLTSDEIAVVFADGTAVRGLGRLTHDLFNDLLDAVAPAVERLPPAQRRVNLLVDRRVPALTLRRVLHTLSRAGVVGFLLAGGTPGDPRAVHIEPTPFFFDPPALRPPIDDIRADLSLVWDGAGARAWALPRPLERAPFAVGFEEPPPDTEPEPALLPERVSLVQQPGDDPPLDAAAVRRLAEALCAFNLAPVGVRLDPRADTSYAELLELLVAALPAPRCNGPRMLGWGDEHPREPGVTVAGLRAHVLARVPAYARKDVPPGR